MLSPAGNRVLAKPERPWKRWKIKNISRLSHSKIRCGCDDQYPLYVQPSVLLPTTKPEEPKKESFVAIDNKECHKGEHKEQHMLRGPATLGTRRLNRRGYDDLQNNRDIDCPQLNEKSANSASLCPYSFSTKKFSNTRLSISLLEKVLNASAAVFTIGSPLRLKEVLSTTGTPVACPKRSIKS